MATTFNSLTDYEFYHNGTGGVSKVVGNEGDGKYIPRVVRYTFTAPKEGASGLSFSKGGIKAYNDSSSTSEILRFYISEDPNSHVKANGSSTYHGAVTMMASGNSYEAKGSVSNLILMPNKTYYLFIFPSYTSFGCWSWITPEQITLTLSGGAGLVRIHNGTDWDAYMVYIHNGTDWEQYMPYIHNGTDWELYTG